MAILIDGYNLLHVTGVFSDAVGPGALEKLHTELLDFLLAALDPADIPQTTIVFDAKGRRAAARRSLQYQGITVHYSARHEDADTQLAELIREHTAPRRLVVVSSDHQVQRAARRRRAKAIDSDVWYAQLLQRRRDRRQSAHRPTESKPSAVMSEHDAAWWLSQFAPELLEEMAAESTPPAKDSRLPSTSRPLTSPTPAKPVEVSKQELAEENLDYGSLDAPFPPSYLAEIEREFLEKKSVVQGNSTPPKPPPRKHVRRNSKQR